MQLNSLDIWLWLAGLVAHIVLLFVLLQRKRAKQFPSFTSWIAFNVVKTLVLFQVHRRCGPLAYYETYLCFSGGDFLLQTAVAYEIALHVFRPAGWWAPGVKQTFALLTGMACAASATLSWLALPATKYLSDTLVIRANLLTAVLLSELFFGMLVFSIRRGFPWKTHAARIAQGLGAYCTFGIIVEALHTYFGLKSGTHVYRTVSHVRMGAYLLAVLYWTVTLIMAAPVERPMPVELQRQLVALQKRASSLVNLLQGGTRA